MVKFLSTRNTLFMIPEQPLLEEQYSSSFTAGTSPTKTRTRKTSKSNTSHNFSKSTKTKKKTVHTSLVKALSMVESADTLQQSSNNSVNTCSTASLTDEDSDISSRDNFEKRQATEVKREAATLWEAPLLRGRRRWCEQRQYLGDEHYLYANVRQRRRDSPPVCPVRKYDN